MLHRNPLVHNYIVNLADGALFGIGIGFASWGTIFPLFISKFTDAQTLIGLIPAIHELLRAKAPWKAGYEKVLMFLSCRLILWRRKFPHH